MKLRLGYVTEFFPFIHTGGYAHKETGIFNDMWRLASESFGYEQLDYENVDEYGGYAPDPNTGRFTGLLGAMQNASIDGTVEDYTYRTGRMEMFYYTNPIDWALRNFYERSDVSTLGSIESFVVFPPLLLFLFLTSTIFVIVVERVILVLRHYIHVKSSEPPSRLDTETVPDLNPGFIAHGRISSFAHDFFFLPPAFSINIFGECRRTVPFLFYLIAIVTVGIIYSATFAGIAFTTHTDPATTIKQMVDELRAGKRILLSTDDAQIKPNTVLEMFGENVMEDASRFRAIPSMQDQFDLLCASKRFVAYITHMETYSDRPDAPARIACHLQIVDTTDFSSFPPSTEIGKEVYGKRTPLTFYFGKHLGRKFRKWFDQVILRMFNEEKIVEFWWRKYTNRPRRETVIKEKYTFTPVPIRAFQIPLIVCGTLIALSIIVLLLEILHKRCFFYRKAYRKFTTVLLSSSNR